jgi:hypothetical protein
MTKNMILVASEWKDQPTFKLIPATLDCPYNEAIFDPKERILAIVGKEKKESFHMLPRLNDNGDIDEVKGKPRPTRKPYKEQRVTVDTYYEYFIRDRKDIEFFIKHFAIIDESSFDYQAFLDQAYTAPVVTTGYSAVQEELEPAEA